MKTLASGLTLLACIFLSGCAPVSLFFESAETIDKGQFEVMGNFSTAYGTSAESGDRETEHTNNNLGLRVGYGITDNIDLKLRYERIMLVSDEEESSMGVNYFGLTPRVSIIKDRLAGGLGLGLYTYNVEESGGDSNESEFAISPGFTFTIPAAENFDITLGTKLDIFTEDDASKVWHMNLGFGISTNASVWSLRPEISIMKDIEEFDSGSWITGGLAFIYKFNSTAKE
jgi:hypothetical protein